MFELENQKVQLGEASVYYFPPVKDFNEEDTLTLTISELDPEVFLF